MSFQKSRMMRDACGEAFIELGRENPSIIVLSPDTAGSTRAKKFALEFPNRFFNLGVAEQNLVGIAAGLAFSGKIPYVSAYAVFVVCRSMDQIRNAIAYPNLNAKIVATHSGIITGADGATHQSIEDVSVMRTMPNMKVIVPADAVATKWAVKKAAEIKGPVYIRLCRPPTPIVYGKDSNFTMGKGVTLRDGDDITIFACGVMVAEALKAADEMKKNEIHARVIDMHTIKPIDEDLIIRVAEETQGIVTAEDHNIIGGLGSAVAEVLAEKRPTPMQRVGVMDTFGESGGREELMVKYGLTADNIKQAALNLISKRK